ncbi:MAG: hypothetical protein WC556_02815 [Candidatus Methanoperedens sp.]
MKLRLWRIRRIIGKFWDWIGKSNSQIQAIMIISLVLVTVWYAYTTNELNNTSKNDFELNNRPWVYFEGQMENTTNGLNFNILLKNEGKFPAEIDITKTVFWVGDEDYSLDFNTTLIIFPNEEGLNINVGYVNPTGVYRLINHKYKNNSVRVGAKINYGFVGGKKPYYTEGYYNPTFQILDNETVAFTSLMPYNFTMK